MTDSRTTIATAINSDLCARCDQLQDWFTDRFNLPRYDDPSDTVEAVEALISQRKVVDEDHDMYLLWMQLRSMVLDFMTTKIDLVA